MQNETATDLGAPPLHAEPEALHDAIAEFGVAQAQLLLAFALFLELHHTLAVMNDLMSPFGRSDAAVPGPRLAYSREA